MNLLIKILNSSWPLIIFSFYIYIQIRILYLIKYKIKIDIVNEITNFLFLGYSIFLFYVVTLPEINYNIINIKLFKEINRYPIGSKLFIKNIVGNIILFIPYGLYLSYHLKISKSYIIAFLGLSFSFLIEVIQIKIGRVFDVDDILLNVLGCLIGFYIFKLLFEKKKT